MNNNNNFMAPGFYDESSTSRENDNITDDNQFLHLRPSGSSNHVSSVEKEHMFDKVVTPSDVGKLNRLVIPKQHAEKYFPLDSSTNEKGLLLNFEDRNGKPWRFRYSYWNSSQSYVMTKGWSRFVKEKKLDAGDIVSFQRGTGETAKDRLFIDWRRRPDAPDLHVPHHFSTFYRSTGHPWNPLFLTPQTTYNTNQVPQYHQFQNQNPYGIGYGSVVNGNPCPPGSIFYLRPGGNAGGGGVGGSGGIVVTGQPRQDVGGQRMVYDSVPVVHGKAAAKRLRLFGVNMDCPVSESDECEMVSSNSTMRLHQYFPTTSTHSPSSSSSVPNSQGNNEEDKGKGSMSLDLDI